MAQITLATAVFLVIWTALTVLLHGRDAQKVCRGATQTNVEASDHEDNGLIAHRRRTITILCQLLIIKFIKNLVYPDMSHYLDMT